MSMEPNPEQIRETPAEQRDDALFEALGKTKKQKKRRIVITVISLVLVLALVLVVLLGALRSQVRQRFASQAQEVECYTVTTGTISTQVSGSGMLMNVDTESVTVPDGVEVTEILVDYGDLVEEGQLLATVDAATVGTALTEIQSQIQSLDGDIRDAAGDKAATSVSAGVKGRVKALYAQPGDRVSAVMVEHGALALLSLDGKMAMKLQSDVLQTGDSVTVLRSTGQELAGTVESAARGTAVILVTDDGPALDEEVTVLSPEGENLGTARLYVHTPLAVTAYAGTVKQINAKLNDVVYATTRLYYLQDTAHTASYDTLLRSRTELEETLLQLLKLQRSGGVTAPVGGSVFSVADLDGEETVTEVAVLSPDVSMSVTLSVDETDILALELEQKADVTVSAISEDVFTGTVTEINKTAADGAYTAEITLDKQPGMLQGMTAEIDVRIQGVENALLIPVDALHKTSTAAFVYTTYDEQTQQYGGRVDVTTGLSNDNYVEITSGLKAGDSVYYTESESFFGRFPGMGGTMPGGNSGGGMPGGNSGGRPGAMSGGPGFRG